MELVRCRKCVVRNYIPEDKEYIFNNHNNDQQFTSLQEIENLIEENKNVDFVSNGIKKVAIANDERIIGELYLDIQPISLVFNFLFYSEFRKPFLISEMLVSVIRHLHNTFKYREIVCYLKKENYQDRSILESLNFKRNYFDKDNSVYAYTLFSPNPNKDN